MAELERPQMPSTVTWVAGGIALIVAYLVLRSVLSTVFWLLRIGIVMAIVVGFVVVASKLASDD